MNIAVIVADLSKKQSISLNTKPRQRDHCDLAHEAADKAEAITR